MPTEDRRRRRPVRRLLSYLISTGPVGDGSWRWRLTTALAFIGPGSVPFALVLLAGHAETLRAEFGTGWGVIPAALASGAIVLARFRPVTAWTMAMVALVLITLGTRQIVSTAWPVTEPLLFTLIIVQFAVARERRVWVSVCTVLSYMVIGGMAAWAYDSGRLAARLAIGFVTDDFTASDNVTLMLTYLAVAFLAGLLVRVWRQGRARVAEEEQVAEAERGRRRMLEERTRIARELHDIVAHHMSVIAVQSSTAEYRLTSLSEETKTEFRSIGEQARDSLSEMRRLLGVLRGDEETGPRSPMPGPESLDALVESVDRAGTPTTLTVGGLPDDLPETLALTVYRVVQEALSNVVRHANGASTQVEVGHREGTVEVTVVNAAPTSGAAPPEPQGTGLGLVGMRERVAILGGELEAGPTGEGGFRVRAALPIGNRDTAQEQAQ